jgi:hypothetical protein
MNVESWNDSLGFNKRYVKDHYYEQNFMDTPPRMELTRFPEPDGRHPYRSKNNAWLV